MEQVQKLELQIPELKCIKGNKAHMACISEACTAYSLLCMTPDCQCFNVIHKNCSLTNLNNMITKIKSKKQKLQPQAKKSYNAILSTFDQAIDILSKYREVVESSYDMFGLDQEQTNFINYLIQDNKQNINGALLKRVKDRIELYQNNNEEKMLPSEQYISKFWKDYKPKLNNLATSMKNLALLNSFGSNSLIVNRLVDVIHICKFSKIVRNLNLLYRASENNFSCQEFHKVCDNIPNTLCLFETEFGTILGGFTEHPWSTTANWISTKKGGQAFIFSMNMGKKFQCKGSNTIYCVAHFGPFFGNDLCVVERENTTNYNNFPSTYNNDLPKSVETQIAFYGASRSGRKLQFRQWEVFEVVFG